MAEVLGRLDPEADTSMLSDYDTFTDLEQAQITCALTKRAKEMMAEAEASETGLVMAKFIVALEDGRVTTARFDVCIPKGEEK